jgi:hypothetical protein
MGLVFKLKNFGGYCVGSRRRPVQGRRSPSGVSFELEQCRGVDTIANGMWSCLQVPSSPNASYTHSQAESGKDDTASLSDVEEAVVVD